MTAPLKLGPFIRGMNNKAPDNELPATKDQGAALRDAVNVDVLPTGTLRRRRGTTLAHAMTLPHSGWSTRDNSVTLFVRASGLYQITSFSPYTEVLLTGLTSNARMAYADIGGVPYFSNGVDSGRVVVGAVLPWGLVTPGTPSISIVAGSLDPAWYQTSITFTNSSGEESGATPSNNTQLLTTGGLRVTIPAAMPNATHVNVYCSGPDGETPLWCAKVAAGSTFYDITALPTGHAVPTPFRDVLPPGVLLAEHNGCLLSADEAGYVYYSDPYNYGLYKPTSGYLAFPNPVTVMAPNENGVYFVSDKTYWFAGADPAKFEGALIPLPYGACFGTQFEVRNLKQVGWFGDLGVVIADNQGQCTAKQEDDVAVDTSPSGASMFREEGGVRVVVVNQLGTVTPAELAEASFAEYDADRLHGL